MTPRRIHGPQGSRTPPSGDASHTHSAKSPIQIIVADDRAIDRKGQRLGPSASTGRSVSFQRLPILTVVVCVTWLVAATSEENASEVTPDSSVVAAGAKLYGQYCEMCHGRRGVGDGLAAPSMNPKPRNLRIPGLFKSKTDQDLFGVVSRGGPTLGLSPLMPAWGAVLKKEEIRQVIAFVRSLADSAPRSRDAEAEGRVVKP